MRACDMVLGLVAALGPPAEPVGPVVRLVEFETTVNPVTAKRITRAIDDAEAAEDTMVLIRLNTPGGDVSSMERVVARMLASRVPVVTWVGPSGAKAASAGLFILVAADVAAMAPGTRTGAASVVALIGPNAPDDVLLRKANNDAAALIRSIAQNRGRNVEACERAVLAAEAYEERVALERGIVDLVARDRDELLRRLDGRPVRRFDPKQTVVLRTAGARFVTSEFDYRQRFLELLGTPEVAFLLLLLGLAGLYVELTNPGLIFPGVVGAMCLLLFALTAQFLPINIVGVLLILLAAILFILEIKVTSHGMLSVAATICLIVGSMMLIDSPIPELRVPAALYVPGSLTLGVLFAVIVRLAVRAQQARVQTGREGLDGAVGTVTQALEPEGTVFVHGELWNAASSAGSIPVGARVRVVGVRNLRLTVEPTEASRGD
jgi:membrane-bound serine protease (ClpP class)